MSRNIIGATDSGLRFEAEDVSRHTSPGGHNKGLRGTVTVQAGSRSDVLGVSRLDNESCWTIDSHFVNGLPAFVNGFGARYLQTYRIKDGEIIAALDSLAGAA